MQNSVFLQLQVTSLFGCAYYLSAEEKDSKRSKKSGKKNTMAVYMGCGGSGKVTEEEEGTGDALAISTFRLSRFSLFLRSSHCAVFLTPV